MKCPSVAPNATPTGFCAAPRAMVANMLRSPHSAMKINVNVSINAATPGDRFCALVDLHTTSVASASSPCSSGVAPLGSMANASLSVLTPKNTNIATAAYSPMGSVGAREDGKF